MLTDLSSSSLALPSQAGVLTPASDSQPSELQLRALLQSHTFRDLFIEVLGWNRANSHHSIEVDGHRFALQAVAQKRGFQVFHAAVDRYTIINRHRLRAIQKRLSSVAHEHILIYTGEQPRRQVWQWGLRWSDGRKHRHLEHPFLSHSPPPQFLSRLSQLAISFEDENTITLLDAIERAQRVLDPSPEYNFFAARPRYAQQSDELWVAMQRGGVKEFQAFVECHYGLMRFFANRWHRRFHLDEDETCQLCALGILQVAKLFDPSRGCLFSSYAGKTVKHRARRMVTDIRLPIHFPQYVLPHCFAMRRLLQQETVAGGPDQAREAVEQELKGVRRPLVQAWYAFQATIDRESLSERGSPAIKAVRQRATPGSDPSSPLVRQEMIEQIRALVDNLNARDRQVVRLYYGFDGEPLTLNEIGLRLHLTRERVRQILNENYGRLRTQLDIVPEDLQALL